MGEGIDLAALDNPEAARLIDNMKDQLIIVLMNRLGGQITIPVDEIDSTRGYLMMMHADIENRHFHFEIKEKQ